MQDLGIRVEGFRKLGGTFLEVPVTRIIALWGVPNLLACRGMKKKIERVLQV